MPDNKFKRAVLLNKYGKFDLIERELSAADILYSKPRVLLQLICERYEIDPCDINRITFYKWLSRTKKAVGKNGSKFIKLSTHGQDKGGFNFQPTDPMELQGKDASPFLAILKRPVYTK